MSPKRRSASSKGRVPFLLGAAAVFALVMFVGGELFVWASSDSGRIATWRHLRLGDRARAVRLIGKRAAEGLARAGIPRERVQEAAGAPSGADLLWRIPLEHDESPMQLNYAITRAVEEGGAVVLSGREKPGPAGAGALVLTLLVGVPGRPTHEIRIERPARVAREEGDPLPQARVALVLYASAEDAGLLAAACRRAEPFAATIIAEGPGRAAVLDAARAAHRELVLHVPMEPENYPRVNPGPGTLLVSMNVRHVEAAVRHWLEDTHGAIAVMNLMGSFATQDESFMTAVYRELKRSGVTFLHLQPAPRSVCRSLASRQGVAYDEPDVLLDAEPRRADARALDRAWSAALTRARTRGQALVLLRVTKTSAPWLDKAFAPKRLEGVRLVPASEVMHRPATL